MLLSLQDVYDGETPVMVEVPRRTAAELVLGCPEGAYDGRLLTRAVLDRERDFNPPAKRDVRLLFVNSRRYFQERDALRGLADALMVLGRRTISPCRVLTGETPETAGLLLTLLRENFLVLPLARDRRGGLRPDGLSVLRHSRYDSPGGSLVARDEWEVMALEVLGERAYCERFRSLRVWLDGWRAHDLLRSARRMYSREVAHAL